MTLPPTLASTLTNVDRLATADYLEVATVDDTVCLLCHCFNGWFELARGSVAACTAMLKVVCASTGLRGVDYNGRSI